MKRLWAYRPGPGNNSRRRKLAVLLTLVALAAVFLAGCRGEPKGPPRQAVVAQVLDGDTVVLDGGQRVRLLGIDAPEMERDGRPAEFLAHKAKSELMELAQGKRVRLEYDQLRYDHYGRLLAYVALPDGTLVNAEMVRRGLARVYFHPPNFGQRETLLAAQHQAMETRRGLWQRPLKQDEPFYPANRSSFRFHRPHCPMAQKIAPANRIKLESLDQAYREGFSPCRSCKPGG